VLSFIRLISDDDNEGIHAPGILNPNSFLICLFIFIKSGSKNILLYNIQYTSGTFFEHLFENINDGLKF
jgi:hypothetical protein